MKKINKYVLRVCIVCLVFLTVSMIQLKFGTYFVDAKSTIYGYVVSVFLPFILLLNILFQNRKNFKTFIKKEWFNILVLSAMLLLSVFAVVIMRANQVYYKPEWIEQRWSWNNCPPIRWDFWSILF